MTQKPDISLFIHNEEVNSLFEILGEEENDLTYSLGYVLSQCPRLLKEIINQVFKNIRFSNAVIKLQESGNDAGFTDFEIIIYNEYFFIIEAKMGWTLPDTNQLKKYLSRFREFKKTKRAFIVLSDCTEEYFKQEYVDSLYGIPIKQLTWTDVILLIDEVYHNVSNRQKILLHELKEYLKEVVIMENHESNKVFVVSLAGDQPYWSELSWKDFVYKRNFYFYPQGKNYPKIPPNYIAFRYDGRLQSIHHVEKYLVVQDVHKYIPEIKKGKIKNHFLLYLGEPFEPRKELPNGNIYSSGRLWCMLDTLFTSKTVKEASEITKKRENQ